MSNTRRANAGKPFRQERFASSAEFERGLLGNLVARRCELLGDADARLVWWLQLLSWADGGLPKLAADILAAYPQRVATASMQEYGFKAGQVYNAEKVETARRELTGEVWAEGFDVELYRAFAVRGEGCDPLFPNDYDPDADQHPTQYAAALFLEKCHELAAKELPGLLVEICLDPALDIATCAPRYFPTLIEALREHSAAWIEARSAGIVVTELGRQVYDCLDYCLETGCMVLIDGLARTGKTFSTKAWCDLHPGRARYAQVPSSNDDIGFFRAIAKSLGVSINQNSKAQQLRDRIEDTLQRGKLALVLDEAHYCFLQSNYRDAVPSRINWIMTALVNQGVPVALVTTPQFMRAQSAVERKSYWTSEQFVGRIGHYKALPDSLSSADLSAVASSLLPEGCARSIATLAAYAEASTKYLAAIESAVRRARYDAQKAGRQKVTFADVRDAIKGSVIPSDTALAGALAAPKKSGRARAISAPVKAPLTAPETPSEPPINGVHRQPRPTEALAPEKPFGADRAKHELTVAD